MDIWKNYDSSVPEIISRLSDIPEMIRLQRVGMNCGCEYTSFPLFGSMKDRYTRFDHSMGTAMIVWRFTNSPAQTLAAAFHDIATPCFAHVVDFMAEDYDRLTAMIDADSINYSPAVTFTDDEIRIMLDQIRRGF